MDEPNLFSEKAIQALSALDPKKKGTGVRKFPKDRVWVDRINEGENPSDWFHRILGEEEEVAWDRIDDCKIEERFAFFGEYRIGDDGSLDYVRFQGLVSMDSDLYDLYGDPKSLGAVYYRLDYDPNCIGDLFTHPVPHLHCGSYSAPRCPFSFREDEFVLVTFLEFIYINHFFGEWSQWARAVASNVGDVDFEAIHNAYQSSLILFKYAEFEEQVPRLKSILSNSRRNRFPHFPSFAPESLSLNYFR